MKLPDLDDLDMAGVHAWKGDPNSLAVAATTGRFRFHAAFRADVGRGRLGARDRGRRTFTSAPPEHHSEERRRPTYHRLVSQGVIPAGYAADDGVALHFVDRDLAYDLLWTFVRTLSARLRSIRGR